MTIERCFDVPLIGEMALREKQVQQVYRPIIAVHKWFARRPGTLLRGLLLAEFASGPLSESFYESHDFPGLRVADPFMGGGTPLIEAKYRTGCPLYGDADVPVKSFLWVKTLSCEGCVRPVDLFPGFVLARDKRHSTNVLICAKCGTLNDAADLEDPGHCSECSAAIQVVGPAKRGRCDCPRCGHANVYPGTPSAPLTHRMFAIEYHNPSRRADHKGRFFKRPDSDDLARVEAAACSWRRLTPRYVPDAEIPAGDESDRLHRWGYFRYRDMSNSRQLLGLELRR